MSDTVGAARRRVVVASVLVLAAAAVLSGVTLAVVGWIASHRTTATGQRLSGPRIGFIRLDKPAPPISLPNLAGHGTVSLAGLAGKPVVVNFWSSTCHPCNAEAPALASVARAMSGKVTFVGIDSADFRKSAIAFVARYKVPYPIAFDPNATADSRYGVAALPETFFLSPSARTILGENIGVLTPAKLRAILARLYKVT